MCGLQTEFEIVFAKRDSHTRARAKQVLMLTPCIAFCVKFPYNMHMLHKVAPCYNDFLLINIYKDGDDFRLSFFFFFSKNATYLNSASQRCQPEDTL